MVELLKRKNELELANGTSEELNHACEDTKQDATISNLLYELL